MDFLDNCVCSKEHKAQILGTTSQEQNIIGRTIILFKSFKYLGIILIDTHEKVGETKYLLHQYNFPKESLFKLNLS